MSSLLLLNGSPRGTSANSAKMLSRVGEGWAGASGGHPAMLHLARRADFERAVDSFHDADVVVIAMPLYTDAMPGLVMSFFEELERYVGRAGNPRLGFLVQSGFSEALHSRHLERYLKKLARRLNCEYAGTIVRGGGEALQVMPDEAAGKLFGRLRGLGESLARDGRFDAELLRRVAGTERFSRATAVVLGAAMKLPGPQFYWNGQLRRNGAWEHRFDAPYAPGAGAAKAARTSSVA